MATTPGDLRRFEMSAYDNASASSTTLIMLPELEKLTSANWHQWRGTMVSILRMKGLLGYVDGTIPILSQSCSKPLPPHPIPTFPMSNSLNPFNKQPTSSTPIYKTDITAYQTWIQNDGAAAAHLCVNIKNTTVLRLRDDAPAANIWVVLIARFERSKGMAVLIAR